MPQKRGCEEGNVLAASKRQKTARGECAAPGVSTGTATSSWRMQDHEDKGHVAATECSSCKEAVGTDPPRGISLPCGHFFCTAGGCARRHVRLFLIGWGTQRRDDGTHAVLCYKCAKPVPPRLFLAHTESEDERLQLQALCLGLPQAMAADSGAVSSAGPEVVVVVGGWNERKYFTPACVVVSPRETVRQTVRRVFGLSECGWGKSLMLGTSSLKVHTSGVDDTKTLAEAIPGIANQMRAKHHLGVLRGSDGQLELATTVFRGMRGVQFLNRNTVDPLDWPTAQLLGTDQTTMLHVRIGQMLFLDGLENTCPLPCYASDDIARLEANCSIATHKAIHGYRLMYNGERLSRDCTLDDYGIMPGDQVDLIRDQCGGMFHPTSGRAGNMDGLCSHSQPPPLDVVLHYGEHSLSLPASTSVAYARKGMESQLSHAHEHSLSSTYARLRTVTRTILEFD
eukprot:TRINITY_DN8259_c0_g1_i1.p1 TRINITY_DN8259_c0_g1~~TRINITY_DN8259_c0_g1_i1.p1  ORF type:complete len:484 (-),score=65.50 TRINITY_DN8259_c0_g1_i1:163-1524(-)